MSTQTKEQCIAARDALMKDDPDNYPDVVAAEKIMLCENIDDKKVNCQSECIQQCNKTQGGRRRSRSRRSRRKSRRAGGRKRMYRVKAVKAWLKRTKRRRKKRKTKKKKKRRRRRRTRR